MKKTLKITETLVLPEAIIHHIQSFMTGKEAARSTVLSKSWYDAWLTRPTLEINERDFPKHGSLEEFAKKAMRRYQELSMKIESFKLTYESTANYYISHNLIVDAVKTGATDLELKFCWMNRFILPQQVLGSKTLLRLDVCFCEIGEDHVIRCSRLKSLSLEHVTIRNSDSDRFKDIITSCCNSLEELSLSGINGFTVSRVNLNELRKLRRLYLKGLAVDSMLFTEFESRFPCLKDLTILSCHGLTSIKIASTSLETIRCNACCTSEFYRVGFDVPNIQKFVYLGDLDNLPPSINGAPKECEFNIPIKGSNGYCARFFLNLRCLLTKFRLSRISLYIYIYDGSTHSVDEVGTKVEGEQILVENLSIYSHSLVRCDLLVRLFRICRSKFVTVYGLPTEPCFYRTLFNDVRERLMHQFITPKSRIPNQYIFGKVKVYKVFDGRPHVLEVSFDAKNIPKTVQNVQFELIWVKSGNTYVY